MFCTRVSSVPCSACFIYKHASFLLKAYLFLIGILESGYHERWKPQVRKLIGSGLNPTPSVTDKQEVWLMSVLSVISTGITSPVYVYVQYLQCTFNAFSNSEYGAELLNDHI
jgi:hypothetical protein